jgi:signal transduction histidine kinase
VPSHLSEFTAEVARRVAEAHRTLAERWLNRLKPLVGVEPNEIFPSVSLLDHIPDLIQRIGEYLATSDHEDIAASSAVIMKAQELGHLRFSQRASVHQILQEYELLGGVLTTFLKEEMTTRSLKPAGTECVDLVNAIGRSISVLRRATLDSFLTRHNEMLTAQTKQIEGFNRMLTHEVRQPLAVLRNVTYLLRQAPAERTDQNLDVLERNVTRLIAITQQLERVARLDSNPDNPVTQEVNLTSAATAAARQLRDMADAKGVQVRVEPGLPSIVTEAARLELVLINLLSNAIKYSDQNKTDRFVEVCGAPAPDGWCAFSIHDNGIGVPADRVETIFSRFVRAHRERDLELEARGLGLGLAIVRECLDSLGGTITVESIEHDGTKFVVMLPVDGR